MKNFFKKMKDESGQALVIVAASVIVLMGVTAFSVDMGMAYNAKAELQAAADAAALAGAQDMPQPFVLIPDYGPAKATAETYAKRNGVEDGHVWVEAPYAGDRKLIEVKCEREFKYLFARVLGFDSKIIKVRAVAERRLIWGGETLPFINIDDNYKTDSQIVLWEQTGTGDFEVLSNLNPPSYEFVEEGKGNDKTTTGCILMGLEDGTLDMRNGLNTGIEKDITDLLKLWSNGDFVYVLSLRDIPTDPVNYISGVDKKKNDGKDSVTIGLEEIVLLKCKIDLLNTETKGSAGDRGIVLTVVDTDPIELVTALKSETYIPGFVNHNVVIKLVQ